MLTVSEALLIMIAFGSLIVAIVAVAQNQRKK